MIPAFVGVDERARIILAGFEEGKKVLLWVHAPRHPEHHRFAFAVMQKIADACGKPVEVVLLWLKYETGRFDLVVLPGGEMARHPHSIAFESMDQKEFQQFWTDALPIIERELGGLDVETRKEIEKMINREVD